MSQGERRRRAPATAGALSGRSAVMAAVEAARRSGRAIGVVHLDLDRFHRVNTRFGHEVGDRVLDAIGARLAKLLPAEGLMARAGGDSFVAVLPDADRPATADLAAVLVAAVRDELVVAGRSMALQASAGVAWVDAGGDEGRPVDVLEAAFLACRRAKATAPGSVAGDDQAQGAEVRRLQHLEDELRRAIADDQLVLHVQPLVDLETGQVEGVEALVRWEHPQHGLLAPGAFLGDADAVGLTVAIGDWVIEHALDMAATWRDHRGGRPLRVWVNLAAAQVADGERLRDQLSAAFEAGRVGPESIGLEVTESSLLEDVPGAVEVLQSLRELGIELALDDFGTGYSSLSYLRQLPVTAVKIDQRFVAGIGDSLADEAIVEAVIDLAHALGLEVVAEGIERPEVAEALARMHADVAQGYHFGRPAPLAWWLDRVDLPWGGAAPPRRADEVAAVQDRHPAFAGSARARLLLTALDTAHDSVVVTVAGEHDALHRAIVYVNAAFEDETGFDRSEVLGRDLAMLLNAPDDPEVLAWFASVGAGATAATTELAHRRADGTTYLCELTINPVFDERGIHTHWLHVRRDLSRRRAAERDRARFEGLIEQTPSLVLLAEARGRWIYANAAMRRAVGIQPDAPLDGYSTVDFVEPDDLVRIRQTIWQELTEHGFWQGPGRLHNPVTGQVTEVEAEIQIVDDPLQPGTRVYAAVCRDVTEQNQAARAEARRAELRAFAVRLAQRALEHDPGELLASIDVLVAELGETMGADLCFLNVVDPLADELRVLAHWQRGVADPLDHRPGAIGGQAIPLARLTAWMAHLADIEHTVVSAHFTDDDPIDDPSRPWRAELAETFPVRANASSMYAALRVEGRVVGVVGMGSTDGSRSFRDDERDALQTIADALANLVNRQQAATALQASRARIAAMLDAVSDVLVVLDDEGYVRYANPAATRRLGHESEQVVGKHFLSFVHPDDRNEAVEAFSATTGGRSLPVTELRVLTADGGAVWFDFDTNGIYDEQVGGFMLSLRDMSVQRAAIQDMARRAEVDGLVTELSQWALEPAGEDVLIGVRPHFERLCHLLHADVAFIEVIEGEALRHLVGWASPTAPPDSFDVPTDQQQVAALIARYRTLEPIVVRDIDEVDEPWAAAWRSFDVCDRSGIIVPLSMGRVCLGAMGVVLLDEARDWSEADVAVVQRVATTLAALIARRHAETALRQSEARLNALLDGSNDIVVVVSDDGVIRYANSAVQRALGFSVVEMVGRHIATVVHPDDLAGALATFAELTADQRPAPVTVRLVPREGTAAWWEITAGATPDPVAGGRVLTCRDVTARRESEAQASRWVELLRFAFDVAQLALDDEPHDFLRQLPTVCTRIGQILGADHCYVDRIDDRCGALVNIGCFDNPTVEHSLVPGGRVPLDQLPSWIARLRQLDPVIVRDVQVAAYDWVAEKRTALGAERGLLVVPMSAAGRLLGLIGVSTTDAPRGWNDDELTFLRIVAETIAHVVEREEVDIERRRLEAELEWQALHDPLTGLGNRILLGRSLDLAIARRGRPNHVTVLLIDLDHFKNVNDTYGHAFGDDVLQIVAMRLTGLTRPTDTLARTGGDEFVLLCPETDPVGARAIAERMIAAVGEPIVVGDVTVHLGASIGIAHGEGDLAVADALLVEADDAMYAAKRDGRGRMRLAEAPRSPT